MPWAILKECQSCLQGMIPKAFENLHRLEVLYLSNNNISGEVLDLTKFPLLEELNPYRNRLNVSLAKSIGKLFKLQVRDVSSNCLQGVITESHLWNVFRLQQLGFSFNSPSLTFSPT